VKVTTQGKVQKSNHSFIKGSEEGAISPKIEPQNSNGDTGSRPGINAHTKERIQDLSRTFNGSNQLSFHDVFCHDVVHSDRFLVTNKGCNGEHAHPAINPVNEMPILSN